jgi:hypothetical protein
MRERQGGRGVHDEDASTTASASVGKRTLIAARYPALTGRMARRDGGGAEPSIHDAATIAVENKDAGSVVDSGVALRVGAHLGVDFSGVRVHQDGLAQEATQAMSARAFAHGGDVFLGPGESGSDLGLMAHELTHVAQQGAAGQRAPQRAVQVGDANSPAEAEADQVSAAVTGGAPPARLLVDTVPTNPGQMLKSQFLDQLGALVLAATEPLLGPEFAGIDSPVAQQLSRYRGMPATAVEAQVRRTTPSAAGVGSAAEMLPIVVARMRVGVETWRQTGQLPPELGGADPAAMATAGPPQAQALRAPDGSATLASLEADLGPGRSLDASVASRMSVALDADLSAVRVHTDERAARMATDAGARALAIGQHVVMGAGAYQPGTVEGDALLAHELAHTVQQAGVGADPVARGKPIAGESAAAEADADAAAEGAMARLLGGQRDAARPKLAGELSLQRCDGRRTTPQPRVDPWVQSMIDFMGAQDRAVIQRIVNDHINIVRFTTAYDTWEYDDGHTEREELTGLRGNTDADTRTIRIRSSLSTQDAAVTLFHEMNHWGRPATSTQNEYLDEEVDVRVQSEEFAIRHHLPETRPGYRNPDSTVNRQNIHDSVYNSSHYNPSGRHRINRQYEGDAPTTGWYVPPP